MHPRESRRVSYINCMYTSNIFVTTVHNNRVYENMSKHTM